MMKKLAEIIKFYQRFGWEGVRLYLKEHSKEKEGSFLEFKTVEAKHPIFLRKATSDFPTFMQVIYKQDYRIHLDYVPETIIDCGANIGLSAVFFANRFPNAKIIAIEPESRNFDVLKKNTEKYDHITAIKAGIWSKTTHLKIVDDKVASWGFRVEETTASDGAAIAAISIEDIMKQHNIEKIDILKIDIEGSEKEIFANNYDEWLSRTKTLIIETHDGFRKDATKTLFRALSGYNYHTSLSGENFVIRFLD